MNWRGNLCLAAVALLYSAPSAARAQSVSDFYRNHDLFLVVGSGPSGGYDVYARILARYWGKYIPGHPHIVVQNMPGAGGLTLMNNLANVERRDGTFVGATFANTVIQPVFDKGAVTRYDSRKLNWIGSISPQSMACFTRKDSPVKTIEEAMKTPLLMASTGESITAMSENVVNAMVGAKFKIIMGYTTAEVPLAIDRKEVDGTCLSAATILAERPNWVLGNGVNWLIVLSNKPDPLLPGVPTAAQFMKTDDDRKVLALITSQLAMGRPYVLPPGVPPDRVAALREAFMATMKDPGFLAQARTSNLLIDPSDYVEMQNLIDYTYSLPDRLVARANALIDATPGQTAPAGSRRAP